MYLKLTGKERTRSRGSVRFGKSGFRIWNRTRKPISDFNDEIPVFGFPFLSRFVGNRKKPGFEKLFLARACIINKKKTTVQENSFANPFSDFPIER